MLFTNGVAFWDGFKVEIREENYQPGRSLIRVVTDFSLAERVGSIGSEHLVSNNSMEPLCYHVFKLHDKVESRIGGLTGIVTSFEQHTNRVIVVSDKIENYGDKRTRYAYKVDELRVHHPDDLTLHPGRHYKINSVLELFATQHPIEPGLVVLYSAEGNPIYTMKRKTSRTVLRCRHGINNIQQMNK